VHHQVPRRGRRAGAGLTGAPARRTAILGGTFNPPHLGHLICAQEALVQLQLDRVVWMPVHSPPHKLTPDDPGLDHRLALCERAIAGEPRFELSRLEADRPGPSYTADTLEALHELEPGDHLTFIVGGDMAHSLPAWRDPERVVRLASLAVAERDGLARDEILEQLSVVPGAAERVQFFDMPRIDISSSLIRRRAAAGLPLRYLVPDAVAAYIEQEGLYGGSREEVVG
jgi:nicotinate-nucleotide adenylyltransferase